MSNNKKVIVTTNNNKVSVGGQICMAIGFILVLGALFMVSSPLIALVVLVLGIVAIVRGYGIKATTITVVSPQTESQTESDTFQPIRLSGGSAAPINNKKTAINKGAI